MKRLTSKCDDRTSENVSNSMVNVSMSAQFAVQSRLCFWRHIALYIFSRAGCHLKSSITFKCFKFIAALNASVRCGLRSDNYIIYHSFLRIYHVCTSEFKHANKYIPRITNYWFLSDRPIQNYTLERRIVTIEENLAILSMYRFWFAKRVPVVQIQFINYTVPDWFNAKQLTQQELSEIRHNFTLHPMPLLRWNFVNKWPS